MRAPQQFIDDLQAVGVSADDPWDLVNRRSSYGPAIPVLLDWLTRLDRDVPQSDRLKFWEGLVRALAVKEARGIASRALVDAFRRPGLDWTVRWAAGSTLAVVADDAVFEDVVELARDRSFGRAREMLMPALGRMANPAAVGVLVEMLDDDDVAGHALVALGKRKAPEVIPHVPRFLDHPTAWVRKEAMRLRRTLQPPPG